MPAAPSPMPWRFLIFRPSQVVCHLFPCAAGAQASSGPSRFLRESAGWDGFFRMRLSSGRLAVRGTWRGGRSALHWWKLYHQLGGCQTYFLFLTERLVLSTFEPLCITFGRVYAGRFAPKMRHALPLARHVPLTQFSTVRSGTPRWTANWRTVIPPLLRMACSSLADLRQAFSYFVVGLLIFSLWLVVAKVYTLLAYSVKCATIPP